MSTKDLMSKLANVQADDNNGSQAERMPALPIICNVGRTFSAMMSGEGEKTEFISVISEMGNEGEKPRLTWVNKTKKGSGIVFLTKLAILHLVTLYNKRFPEDQITVS